MNTNEYLQAILDDQNLKDGSPEIEELNQHREDVEALLQAELESSPHIRYGGSRAKGTMNREAYDLDIICYFDHEDDDDGETLADLYSSVKQILDTDYLTEQKTCSIRLKSKQRESFATDFHIDVVPGRYVDESRSDCFLHQTHGEKQRLKTNLKVHIEHIRDSGVVPAIRLIKLWKARRSLRIKQFVLELLVIDILADEKDLSLSDQLVHFWTTISESEDPITVEDPANPEGNDLTPLLTSDVWYELRSAAENSLWQIDNDSWEAVFGEIEEGEDDDEEKSARARRAAASVSTPTEPWANMKQQCLEEERNVS